MILLRSFEDFAAIKSPKILTMAVEISRHPCQKNEYLLCSRSTVDVLLIPRH
jgi:hypothetical protein